MYMEHFKEIMLTLLRWEDVSIIPPVKRFKTLELFKQGHPEKNEESLVLLKFDLVLANLRNVNYK